MGWREALEGPGLEKSGDCEPSGCTKMADSVERQGEVAQE